MKISTELINRYLKNECSQEEEMFLLDWYASFDDDPDPLNSLPESQQKELKAHMLERIREKLKYQVLPASGPEQSKNRFRYYISAAAGILIVFSACFFFLSDRFSGKADVVKESFVFRNDSPVLKRYVLPDGSSVWLKASTSLTYFTGPANKFREVNLEGECFFDVVHDASRPFVIHTGELSTKVLGTSFNIKASRGGSAAEISVVTGKVLVYVPGKDLPASKGVVLSADQKVVYNSGSNKIEQKKTAGDDLRMWEKTSVSFDNVPLSKVVRSLNSKFNVKITIEDAKVNNYALKADFTGESLPVILDMISKSLDVSCEIKDNQICIKEIENY